MAKEVKKLEIDDVLKVSRGNLQCYIVGTTPLICNRMSEKAKHDLLLGGRRKTAIEKATTLKHDPYGEYRASVYRLPEPAPTLIGVMATAIKGAMRSAALDLPGASKAQIGRLTYIHGDYVAVFGRPKLFMAVTRSSDMAKTPDVRTRAILPEWALAIRVEYTQPLIRPQAVANLLAAAGINIGIGDWRAEKGAGNYGQFELSDPDDATYQRIVAEGGRAAQIAALETPEAYDEETLELLSWYDSAIEDRRRKGAA